MPQPTPQDVHIDAVLTSISVAFKQDPNSFIAEKVFPTVPVQKQSDLYRLYDKGFFLRNVMEKRAPGTESAGGGYEVSNLTYLCDVWALHKDVDDQTRANTDDPLRPDQDATMWLMEQGMIRKEIEFMDNYFKVGVWATDVVGGTNFTKWDDAASDPEKDVQVGVKAILEATGRKPSDMTVSFATHQALKRNAVIRDKMKYTSSDSLTPAMLAAFFEIQRYHVAESIYSTDNEGVATDTTTFIAGNNCLLTYAPPSPGLQTPTAGYNFIWSGLTGLNNMGVTISNFREQKIKSDRIEIEMAFDQKVVSNELGYFLSNTVD